MPPPILLEVCVETVASAMAAERGGAHRVELCSDLAVEGVTPSPELIQQVRQQLTIPLHALIRPRAGDFRYSTVEFEAIKNEIRRAKQLGVNGLVFGVLDSRERVDVSRTRELVELARPLRVTFHRAFDACADLPAALEDVVTTGADRILTSGGAQTAQEGSAMLAQLVKCAARRIAILACGRIREENVRRVVDTTGVSEVHASMLPRDKSSANLRHESDDGPCVVSSAAVARFLKAASNQPSSPGVDR
ncbi:MAG TPA: copper homeostasis protein CutC [Terriglobales bacterium]|nr:copper homeostasis protein CutC [Terriglobales bacterium]